MFFADMPLFIKTISFPLNSYITNSAIMNITEDYLKEKFTEYNVKYFNGKLELPRITLTTSRTQLGLMKCKRYPISSGLKASDFEIRISTYYDLSEKDVQNVLVHEMIHLFISSSGLIDISPHGNIFHAIMDSLNHNFGLQIHVSENGRIARQVSRIPFKEHIILAIMIRRYGCFLSVINKKYAINIAKQIKDLVDVEICEWFISEDEYFSNYPVVRTLRGIHVSKEKFDDMRQKMKPLDMSIMKLI
jgi:hypothetical protein